MQRLKQKARAEYAETDTAAVSDFDGFTSYDEKFLNDDSIFNKREGDVMDGFIGGDITEARAATKLQQLQYEVWICFLPFF